MQRIRYCLILAALKPNHDFRRRSGSEVGSGRKGAGTPMFYCGDDSAAKETVAHLAADLGFIPINAGPLSNARLLEPHALLWVWLALQGGLGRDFAFQIVKR